MLILKVALFGASDDHLTAPEGTLWRHVSKMSFGNRYVGSGRAMEKSSDLGLRGYILALMTYHTSSLFCRTICILKDFNTQNWFKSIQAIRRTPDVHKVGLLICSQMFYRFMFRERLSTVRNWENSTRKSWVKGFTWNVPRIWYFGGQKWPEKMMKSSADAYGMVVGETAQYTWNGLRFWRDCTSFSVEIKLFFSTAGLVVDVWADKWKRSNGSEQDVLGIGRQCWNEHYMEALSEWSTDIVNAEHLLIYDRKTNCNSSWGYKHTWNAPKPFYATSTTYART